MTTTAPVSASGATASAGGASSEFFAHQAPHTSPANAIVATVPHMTPRIGKTRGAVPHQMHFPFLRG
jgi:hypothetical protein